MAENWKIEKGLCRCCHSEGSFHQLSELCTIGGEEGYYTDMLRLTLDITIEPVEEPRYSTIYNTICDDCILRVKDATAFKQQVRRCEARFLEMYAKGVIKVEAPPVIKQEPDTDDQKMDTDFGDMSDDNDASYNLESEPAMEVNIEICKEEPDVDLRRSVRTKKAAVRPQATENPKPKQKVIKKPRKIVKKIQPKPESSGDTKDEKDSGKGAMPAFRLTDEDFWQDGDLYHCGRCEKQYDKFYSLKFHIKTKHYKIPRFTCPYCVAKFMTPAPLTIHKLQEHNIDERFKCNACKGAFNTKIQLRKHINNFHMLGERHKCEFCDYESFSFEGLYKHKFKHKTVKDYHCRFCRKSFLRKTTLDLHERIHTGDRRKICNVCGQAFVQKASLNYHMAKYHPEVNF